MMKRCFKCGETQPLAAFYPHPRMADGHLNKCKECTKRDAKNRYDAKPEVIAAYERAREQTPARRQKKLGYEQKHRRVHPERYRARQCVANAIRDGRLAKLPCEVCGSQETEAYHDDYAKPLSVRWLCFKHHRETAHGQRVLSA